MRKRYIIAIVVAIFVIVALILLYGPASVDPGAA